MLLYQVALLSLVFQAKDLLASSFPVLIMALLSFLPQEGRSFFLYGLQRVDKQVFSWSQTIYCTRQTGQYGQQQLWLPASSCCPAFFLLPTSATFG